MMEGALTASCCISQRLKESVNDKGPPEPQKKAENSDSHHSGSRLIFETNLLVLLLTAKSECVRLMKWLIRAE